MAESMMRVGGVSTMDSFLPNNNGLAEMFTFDTNKRAAAAKYVDSLDPVGKAIQAIMARLDTALSAELPIKIIRVAEGLELLDPTLISRLEAVWRKAIVEILPGADVSVQASPEGHIRNLVAGVARRCPHYMELCDAADDHPLKMDDNGKFVLQMLSSRFFLKYFEVPSETEAKARIGSVLWAKALRFERGEPAEKMMEFGEAKAVLAAFHGSATINNCISFLQPTAIMQIMQRGMVPSPKIVSRFEMILQKERDAWKMRHAMFEQHRNQQRAAQKSETKQAPPAAAFKSDDGLNHATEATAVSASAPVAGSDGADSVLVTGGAAAATKVVDSTEPVVGACDGGAGGAAGIAVAAEQTEEGSDGPSARDSELAAMNTVD